MKQHEERSLRKATGTGAGEWSEDELEALLRNAHASEEALASGIAFARGWLSTRALAPLLALVVDAGRSERIRREAAEAVAFIADGYTRRFLRIAAASPP